MSSVRLALILLAGSLAIGCGRNVQTPDSRSFQGAPQEDPHKVLRDLTQALDKATELSHFRQALPLANTVLSRHEQPPRLDDADRAFLKDLANLTQDELTSIEAA